MSVESTDSYDENDERPYVSTMHLNPVTFMHVGYYYCVKQSAMTQEFVEKVDNQWAAVSEIIRKYYIFRDNK